MTGKASSNRRQGYLPNERPPWMVLTLFGAQHVLAMFPATVLVALLCGFHTSTVLLAAGLATVSALVLSRNSIGTFLPLFYGSSFSYIASYLSIHEAITDKPVSFGVPAEDHVIATMQAGILATGLFNIVVGFIIRAIGKNRLDQVLPPVVTGSVACVIGFALAGAAMNMSFNSGYWSIALLTLLATVAFSHLLRGIGWIGMFPVLLGALVGYVLTLVIAPDQISFQAVQDAPLLAMPHVTLPDFSSPLLVTAIFSISIMALATIPESTAHLYQMSVYVDRLASDEGTERVGLERHIGVNLICDGVGDVICGLCGGPAGTNYGENNSLMAITRCFSGWALLGAGVFSIVLAFVGPVSALVGTVPVFVSGGLAVYLFGAIGLQGVALMQHYRVNLFRPLQLAIGSTIMVVGIGGHMGFEGGLLPIYVPGVFPNGLPAIATAAMLGILIHVTLGSLRRDEDVVGPVQVSIGPATSESSPEESDG